MTGKRCRPLIASDLWRHAGKLGAGTFWKHLFMIPGFRYAVLLLRHYAIRYGIDISRDARIGSGLYIGHFGGICVSGGAVIGDNCNISQGVTLGQQNRGDTAGCPVIGDNVYIAPGAKIIGRVKIGDHASIGANALVVNDVAPHTGVGGIPARPVSDQGSEGYVNRTDYPPVPEK